MPESPIASSEMDSNSSKIVKERRRRKNEPNIKLCSHDFMHDTTSSSDCESEIHCASDEREFSFEQEVLVMKRSKQIHKRRNRVRRKGKVHLIKNSNESDMTVDQSTITYDKTSNQLNKLSLSENVHFERQDFRKNAINNNKIQSENLNRKRNGSKSSWTDSGVSMSQSSTLGELPIRNQRLNDEISSTKITETALEERLFKKRASPSFHQEICEHSCNFIKCNKTYSQSPTVSGNVGRTNSSLSQEKEKLCCSSDKPVIRDEKSRCRPEKLHGRPNKDRSHSDISNCNTKLNADSPVASVSDDMTVALIGKDIKHRSRSVANSPNHEPRSRKPRSQSATTSEFNDLQVQAAWISKNRNGVEEDECEKSKKLRKKLLKPINHGNSRYPEIIKQEKQGSINYDDNHIKVVLSKKIHNKNIADLSLQNTEWTKENDEVFNEEESQIIEQLLENAKSQTTKKFSVQSASSFESMDSSIGDNTREKMNRTKLQKFKDLLKIKRKASVNEALVTSQQMHDEKREISAEKQNPQINALDDHCQNEYFFCNSDDDYNHLQHLGKDVVSKKKKFFKRIFRVSTENPRSPTEPSSSTQVNKEPDYKVNWKRTRSTRSLPDYLRQMWLWTKSTSNDSIKPQIQANGYTVTKMNFKRSNSTHSIHNCDICCQLSNELHTRSEVLSPPSPFRRSKSLRSLSGNYDIATHILQPRDNEAEQIENNNLFCHPYFEGHTTRDIERIQLEMPSSTNSRDNTDQSYSTANEEDFSPRHNKAFKCRRNYSKSFDSNCASPDYSHGNMSCLESTADHSNDVNTQSIKGDEEMIVAPLQVTVMHERHAGKIQLRGNAFKSSV